jgi:hypothetical protein
MGLVRRDRDLFSQIAPLARQFDALHQRRSITAALQGDSSLGPITKEIERILNAQGGGLWLQGAAVPDVRKLNAELSRLNAVNPSMREMQNILGLHGPRQQRALDVLAPGWQRGVVSLESALFPVAMRKIENLTRSHLGMVNKWGAYEAAFGQRDKFAEAVRNMRREDEHLLKIALGDDAVLLRRQTFASHPIVRRYFEELGHGELTFRELAEQIQQDRLAGSLPVIEADDTEDGDGDAEV